MNIEFMKIMETGGPLMWVIFIVAIHAFSLIAWQMMVTLKKLKNSYLEYQWLQDNDDIFSFRGGNSKSPVALMIKSINKKYITVEKNVADEINMQLTSLVPKQAGYMETIATIGSLLPMLGLLGTVLGMINVFEVIAIHGSGKPEAMAEGISQALLTTASGLVFAIPVIFMHHLLSKKLNELLVLIHQSAQLIIARSHAITAGIRHE